MVTPRKLFDHAIHGDWTTVGLDVQFCITRTAREIIISYQCTKSALDWILDASCLPISDRRGSMRHRGFYLAHLSSYRKVILAAVGNTEPQDAPAITAIGYSLGGPLAGQLVHELKEAGYQVKGFTFASPRWLWGEDSADDPIVNYRVRGDLLASIFPKFLGYRDAGKATWLGKRSMLSLTKHEPEAYRTALEKLEEEERIK